MRRYFRRHPALHSPRAYGLETSPLIAPVPRRALLVGVILLSLFVIGLDILEEAGVLKT